MSSDQKFQWVSFFSILIGFALILWELQQSRDMTAAVIANDGSFARAELDMQIASFAEVYVRACQENAELADEDKFVLMQIYRAYYDVRVNRLINYQEALDTGVAWRGNAERFFYFLFDTEFGRKHWIKIKDGMPAEVAMIGDKILPDFNERKPCFFSLPPSLTLR
jgi:hypothetical protein